MTNNNNEFQDSENLENEEVVLEDNFDEIEIDEYDGEIEEEDNSEDKDAIINELKAKAEELEKKNKQLYARTKKKDTKPKGNSDTVITEEDVLKIAAGVSDEDITEAKMVAGMKGIALKDALQTDEYKALKQIREEKEKSQKAQLRVSRGKKAYNKPSFSDKNLDVETHKELWANWQRKK